MALKQFSIIIVSLLLTMACEEPPPSDITLIGEWPNAVKIEAESAGLNIDNGMEETIFYLFWASNII